MKRKFENVYKFLRKVPRGKVTTYKELARISNLHPRAVGILMNKNPYSPRVPCHRVIYSNGEVGGYASGVNNKIKLLEKEGIRVKKGKVEDFKKKLFIF